MFNLRLRIWYSILIVGLFTSNVNCFGAKLSMNLQQSGFHRTIKYITVFTDPPEKPCDFHLKQVIPSSAYVSLDQLDDLERFDKIEYYTEAVVDIEGITSKSSQFNVYLYGDTASLFVIQLPLHFRYHSPGHSSFVKANIYNPELYVDCHGQNVTYDRPAVELICRKTNSTCNWFNIDYEIHSEPITINVPIGQIHFAGVVSTVTILISWIGSYYIARALTRKAASLKGRL